MIGIHKGKRRRLRHVWTYEETIISHTLNLWNEHGGVKSQSVTSRTKVGRSTFWEINYSLSWYDFEGHGLKHWHIVKPTNGWESMTLKKMYRSDIYCWRKTIVIMWLWVIMIRMAKTFWRLTWHNGTLRSMMMFGWQIV